MRTCGGYREPNRFLEEAPEAASGWVFASSRSPGWRSYGLSEVALPVMTEGAQKVHEAVLLTRRAG